MPKVKIDSPAPGFALKDYRGVAVDSADFRGKQHVVLIFNRGFS